jgi:predicted hydrolase (HD superfamily)
LQRNVRLAITAKDRQPGGVVAGETWPPIRAVEVADKKKMKDKAFARGCEALKVGMTAI